MYREFRIFIKENNMNWRRFKGFWYILEKLQTAVPAEG
jgi:hypothetical protein